MGDVEANQEADEKEDEEKNEEQNENEKENDEEKSERIGTIDSTKTAKPINHFSFLFFFFATSSNHSPIFN